MTSRPRATLASTSLTPEERLRFMEQTLRLLRDFYVGIGATPKMIRDAIAGSQSRQGRRAYRMSEAAAFEIFRGAAELINAWYKESSYVDDVGAPRALSRAGPASFETLSRRFLPDHASDDVAAHFADIGLVVRLANGTLKPRRRTALIARLNGMTLDRVAVLMHGMLGTLDWNYLSRGTEQPRLERQVHETRLPAALIPEFNAKAKELGGLLISQLEGWLASREKPASADTATARVGIGLFAYVEPSDAPRSNRRRSSRSRG